MSRIARAFDRLRADGAGAFIPYLCGGDPDREFTMDLMKHVCASGADIIELGVPFSDPVADGPVIQQAMGRSLSGGFRVSHVFEVIADARNNGLEQPIVVMSYYNPILRYGPKAFCGKLEECGADGLLVVDLPPEESAEIDAAAKSTGLDVIRLIAPNTNEGRMQEILEKASGFVYAVSIAGTTGARQSLPSTAASLLKRVCAKSRVPVALGFGISSPEHVVDAIAAGASGVVEGSKLASIYSEHLDDKRKALDLASQHVKEMKAATTRHPR